MPTVAECSGACWPNSFMGMGRSTIAKAMENVLISPGEPSSPNDWMLKRLIPCLENNLFSTSADILKALTVIIRTQHQTSCGIVREEANTEKTYLLPVQVTNDAYKTPLTGRIRVERATTVAEFMLKAAASYVSQFMLTGR